MATRNTQVARVDVRPQGRMQALTVTAPENSGSLPGGQRRNQDAGPRSNRRISMLALISAALNDDSRLMLGISGHRQIKSGWATHAAVQHDLCEGPQPRLWPHDLGRIFKVDEAGQLKGGTLNAKDPASRPSGCLFRLERDLDA